VKPYYEHGGVTIFHGDCREILPAIPGLGDLVFTSPPYNCGMDYGVADDDMSLRDYFAGIEDAFSASARALGSGGYMVANVPSWIGSRGEQVFAFDEYRAIMGRCLPFEDLIIWDKGPPRGTAWGNYPTSPRVRAGHEWLLVYRSAGTRSQGSDISWSEWSRLTQSVWKVPAILPYGDKHPATFPIALARRVVSLYSPAGGQVLDPYAGTGTTLAAAKHLGRRAIGIEIEERYCEIAAKRLAQETLPLTGAA
jgi:DNA modification methylase